MLSATLCKSDSTASSSLDTHNTVAMSQLRPNPKDSLSIVERRSRFAVDRKISRAITVRNKSVRCANEASETE